MLNKNVENHYKPTNIPKGFEEISKTMKEHYEEILSSLNKHNYNTENFPEIEELSSLNDVGAAKAYPIQGILKYHGMSDWDNRIAYLPSISLNNSAAYTKTYTEFNSNFKEDIAIINEEKAEGRELERIKQTLDTLREITNTDTKALVVSKNYSVKGAKGLGTSASGSAALALSAIEATLGEGYIKNSRFASVISRYVAGSGCRSATGGISLWLSYPGIKSINSYSLRIDKDKFKDIGLITIPIKPTFEIKTEKGYEKFKTEFAHKDAPKSDFFKEWMLTRKDKVIDILDSIDRSNWKRIAQYAELDTIHLHGVTMSGKNLDELNESKIIAWEPETIKIMRKVNELRENDIPVYYSIDTGPTPVLITDKKYVDEVYESIYKMNLGFDIIKSEIGGKSEILDPKETKEELFTTKVKKLLK